MKIETITSILAATAILATAWMLQGTEHENAWIYVTAVSVVAIIASGTYSKKKKDKG